MSCLDNNKFIKGDAACMDEYNKTKNTKLDLYYNPIVNYCKIGDNVSKDPVCIDFYNNYNTNTQSTYLKNFNTFMADDYNKWNTAWKTAGCVTNLPIELYNTMITESKDADRNTIINNFKRSTSNANRNTCYSGDTLEVDMPLTKNTCIYSKNRNFKLCQSSNGDLVLYNIGKNTSKIINNRNGTDYVSPRLVVQSDGNVVNYDAYNNFFWSTGTQTSADVVNKKTFLVVRDDGKVVFYNEDGKVVKEINSIEPFSEPSNCCTPDDLMNKLECSNDYTESYKVYLKDMNKYCKYNNNVIDKDMCDELFNNEFNLNDHDILIAHKKTKCLEPNNYMNNKCLEFNNKYVNQLDQQYDHCKSNFFSSECKDLYSKYKDMDPNNEYVHNVNVFIFMIVLICTFVILLSGGGYYYFKVKKNKKI